MTREEHLQFCKRCKNRKMSDEGLICSLTGKKADFEETCPDFLEDESVDGRGAWERMQEKSENERYKMTAHQDLFYAILGGFFISIISALIWAVITVSTEYQIGYMAIGVGFLVGMGVRFFGAGVDLSFGIVGAFFAFLGCALGNLFSQLGFLAEMQQIGYFETLAYLNFDTIVLIFTESFSAMDLLFYAIAIGEGYKLAIRPEPENLHELEDAPPPYLHLRRPLAIVCFVLLSFSFYMLSGSTSGPVTYYDESGNLQSEGYMVGGVEEGEWRYYYPSGRTYLSGTFSQGLEEGLWSWFYESGEIQKTSEYGNGLQDGWTVGYSPEGTVIDSAFYVSGRIDGMYKSFHTNGNLKEAGMYKRDKPDGNWKLYYDDGVLNSDMNFNAGTLTGSLKIFFEDGSPQSEIEVTENEIQEIINLWDMEGNELVIDGDGTFITFHDNGNKNEVGQVIDRKKQGIWKKYYPNGEPMEEGTIKNDIYYLETAWDEAGNLMVENGSGSYKLYNEDDSNLVILSGEYENGLKQGNWLIYNPATSLLLSDLNWKDGKLNGNQTYYHENGGFQAEGALIDDKKDGTWTWYYQTGGVHTSVDYVDDLKEGEQLFYSELGILVKREVYENGILVSEELIEP